MPIDNLLRPDNRLLGFGTGDFSFYGGQPNPGVVVSRIGAVDPATVPRDAGANDAAAAGAPDTATAAPLDATPAAPVEPAAGSPASAPPAPVQATDHHDATSVQPTGGGSTSPLIVAQSPVANPDGDAVAGSAATTPAGATALDSIDDGPILTGLSPLLDLLAGDTATSARLAQVDAAIGNTSDVIGDLAGSVRGDLADALSGMLGGTQAALGDIAGAVQAPVHDIDTLIFSGSDPAGGIATLVGLVETSELFTIGRAETPAAPDASGSIVDDLVADAGLVPPLLGEDADHHDPLGDDGPHLGL